MHSEFESLYYLGIQLSCKISHTGSSWGTSLLKAHPYVWAPHSSGHPGVSTRWTRLAGRCMPGEPSHLTPASPYFLIHCFRVVRVSEYKILRKQHKRKRTIPEFREVSGKCILNSESLYLYSYRKILYSREIQAPRNLPFSDHKGQGDLWSRNPSTTYKYSVERTRTRAQEKENDTEFKGYLESIQKCILNSESLYYIERMIYSREI